MTRHSLRSRSPLRAMSAAGLGEQSCVSTARTPSLLFNNLCARQNTVAFAHRNEVWVVPTQPHEASAEVSVRSKGSEAVRALCWHTSRDRPCLLLGVNHSVQVWGMTANSPASLFSHALGAESDSDFEQAAFTTVCSLPGGFAAGSSRGTMTFFREAASLAEFELAASNDGSVHCSHVITCSIAVPDSTQLVTGDDAGNLVVWDSQTCAPLKTFTLPRPAVCTSLVALGPFVIVASNDGALRAYALETTRIRFEVAAHARSISALALNANRDKLISVAEDNLIAVWRLSRPDANTLRIAHAKSYAAKSGPLTGVAFLPMHSDAFAVAAYDRDEVTIYEPGNSF